MEKFTEDDCKIIKKIKDVLNEHNVNIITSYKSGDSYYLITDFMIIAYSEKESLLDIAFHISTRADVASFFTLVLTDLEEINDINIMEVYMRDENGIVISGNECIEKNQINMKNNIINDFVGEQVQLHYLHNSQFGGTC